MDQSQETSARSRVNIEPLRLIKATNIYKYLSLFCFSLLSRSRNNLQKYWPAIVTCVRNISADSTDLKGVLADKIPKEQERVKNFRKAHGATKVGEVTVDMVS